MARAKSRTLSWRIARAGAPRRGGRRGAAAGAAGPARAAAPRRGAVVAGPATPAMERAAGNAAAEGVVVKVIELTDWITPNESLADGSVDVNYFQHRPFLENAKATRHYDFVAVAPGTVNRIGLYSKRIDSLDQLRTGARVAIANDPVNAGRGLLLLQRAGVVRLTDGVGVRATSADIVDNPKRIRLVELEAAQLARALDDVDVAQGYPQFLIPAGVDPHKALLLDGLDATYALQFVTRPALAADPRVAALVRAYRQPDVMSLLQAAYGDLIQPAWT